MQIFIPLSFLTHPFFPGQDVGRHHFVVRLNVSDQPCIFLLWILNLNSYDRNKYVFKDADVYQLNKPVRGKKVRVEAPHPVSPL